MNYLYTPENAGGSTESVWAMRRKHLSISILTKINNLSQSAKLFCTSSVFSEITGRNPGLAAYFAFSFRCTLKKYVCHRMCRFVHFGAQTGFGTVHPLYVCHHTQPEIRSAPQMPFYDVLWCIGPLRATKWAGGEAQCALEDRRTTVSPRREFRVVEAVLRQTAARGPTLETPLRAFFRKCGAPMPDMGHRRTVRRIVAA